MSQDFGQPCSPNQKCTLHNLHCSYPNCHKGRNERETTMQFNHAPQLIAAAKVGMGVGTEHCAWLRFTGHRDYYDSRKNQVVLCDSDSPGAFKVYRHPPRSKRAYRMETCSG